ncbi:MAG TPA: c-type cytochrome domain-containing protein [Chitinophagaceae bacterium]|nr:c-type cytochrome domain-containing protein [Chitinophagaceae bacterium]
MVLLTLPELIGHLHPLLVHLPIGILCVALLAAWLARRPSFRYLAPALPLLLLAGLLSALVSVLTGLTLAGLDDYDPGLAGWHRWMGIATTLGSAGAYASYRLAGWARLRPYFLAALVPLLLITGHLGGSLTHGSDYLSRPLATLFQAPASSAGRAVFAKPLPDIQHAVAYKDLVQPILQARCYSCHGPSKQKGRLRLDQPEGILKGGKDGQVLAAGRPEQSELIKRILLPLHNEDHMPPREKPQLNPAEITLLRWWVLDSADFTRRVRDLPQPGEVRAILADLQKGLPGATGTPADLPDRSVPPADQQALAALRQAGAVVLPLGQETHYLSVILRNAPAFSDSSLRLLLPLREQLLWLDLAHTRVTDRGLRDLAQLAGLTRLHLEYTRVGDSALAALQSLTHLRYLNLAGTAVTGRGLSQLKNLKELRNIYVYGSRVDRSGWANLQRWFPRAALDSGGYIVPLFATDTTLVQPPPNK